MDTHGTLMCPLCVDGHITPRANTAERCAVCAMCAACVLCVPYVLRTVHSAQRTSHNAQRT